MRGDAERKKSKMKKKEHVRKNKGKDSSLRGLLRCKRRSNASSNWKPISLP
jgi:hypothetical protein